MTVRSVCLISREYPPDTAFGGIASLVEMEARALVDAGLIVHVISYAPNGEDKRIVQDGVVVHRVPQQAVNTPPDMPYVGQGAWSATIAQRYAALDELVRFDVVQAQDYYGESLHLVRRPETPLVIRLHALSRVVAERSRRVRSAGHRAAEALELVALGGADMLLAPTKLVLEASREAAGEALPPAELLPPQIDPARLGETSIRARRGMGPLRLLFVGRLEPLKGPEHALRVAAAAKRNGIDVELTLVGRDIPQDGQSSYRAETLLPLARELGLGLDEIRFVSQLPPEGVGRHLRHADVALLPSAFENFHTAAVEAIAAGVPVICGGQSGLAHWLTPEEGLRPIPLDDPELFAETAATALADERWLEQARAEGPKRVRELFAPAAVTERQLAIYETLTEERRPAVVSSTDATSAAGPSFGIVILAHNARAFTARCLQSVLAHTDCPFHIYLVDNASTDGTGDWARGLDERITVIRSEENAGVSGGRNLGIDAIAGDPDYVVFLDNDVELMHDWWRPFVAALEADPTAGIAGELGVRLEIHAHDRTATTLTGTGPETADMVTGFCMVMRAETVRETGRFDEGLGLFWHDDDDYCLRAGRLGWGVLHVGSGRVAHYEHRSSVLVEGIWHAPETPSDLSQRNRRYLASKWARLANPDGSLDGARGVAVVVFADELLEDPTLFAAYSAAFGPDDDATLVVYAPGAAPGPLAEQLQQAFELDDAPDLLLLAVPESEDTDQLVALGADAVLTGRETPDAFHAAARFDASEIDALRRLAERRWTRLAVAS
jgi:glycogen(starch) synthase